ncbi:hypothetical protein [Tomitella gaofuii]|uniref:hypothetical protein n=1 Tax=Tomitella gaofuii TaxID=2760083 RepID=UPI0015FDA2C6|nr:hypothetical protein [Tomitella gaofuii]
MADVESVTVGGAVLDADVYEWSADGELRLLRGVFPDRFRSVTVTLEHGYEDAPDVAAVVLSVAARAGASPMGYTREQVGGISLTHGTVGGMVAGGTFMADERAKLDRYVAEVH